MTLALSHTHTAHHAPNNTHRKSLTQTDQFTTPPPSSPMRHIPSSTPTRTAVPSTHFNTVQCSAVLYNTIQHSTAQHSTSTNTATFSVLQQPIRCVFGSSRDILSSVSITPRLQYFFSFCQQAGLDLCNRCIAVSHPVENSDSPTVVLILLVSILF